MRIVPFIIGLVVFITSCNNSTNKIEENPNIHKVVVEDVRNAGGYTYLLVKEKEKMQWLAVNETPAQKGETYYYEGGMIMNNFESELLDTTFESLVFLDHISKEPIEHAKKDEQQVMMHHHGSKASNMKQMLNVEPAKDGITISELYKNKKNYEGKKVRIRGIVTKFNEAIMNTNWIHIQDGSEFEGEYDITARTDAMVNNGDTIILTGSIALDIDFGNGYTYKVIMEDAKVE